MLYKNSKFLDVNSSQPALITQHRPMPESLLNLLAVHNVLQCHEYRWLTSITHLLIIPALAYAGAGLYASGRILQPKKDLNVMNIKYINLAVDENETVNK